jgi:hypothetical protein
MASQGRVEFDTVGDLLTSLRVVRTFRGKNKVLPDRHDTSFFLSERTINYTIIPEKT